MGKELEKKLAAAEFASHNGKVLRTINILRTKYNRLKSIGAALELEGHELADSVNYLHEEGYIHLRDYASKSPKSLADGSLEDLEAKLTGKGIRLLAGASTDPCVEV